MEKSQQENLYEQTQKFKSNFIVVKTNFNKIIGGYFPQPWYKGIYNTFVGSFIFHFDQGKLKSIWRKRKGIFCKQFSNNLAFISFNPGFYIQVERKMMFSEDYTKLPFERIEWQDEFKGDNDKELIIAGGSDNRFKSVQLEVWGVN